MSSSRGYEKFGNGPVRARLQAIEALDRPWACSTPASSPCCPPSAFRCRCTTTSFWRQSLADGVYRSSGALIAPGDAGRSRHVGSELSLRVEWRADRNSTFVTSYSHFFAGAFLREAGLGHDVDFLALWLSYRL